MGKTLCKSQNVSLNGFFWGKHHPAPAVDAMAVYQPQSERLGVEITSD